MTDRRKNFWNGIAGSLVLVAMLGAAAPSAVGHVTIYRVCDFGVNIPSSTPDDPRYQRNRGAALKGAFDLWSGQAVELAGEQYADFTHATDKTILCDVVAGASPRQFMCNITGEPCYEVPNCTDPALVALGCEENPD